MNVLKSKFWCVLSGILIFAGMMAFFAAHPLYIYDSDDWHYISFSRHALPSVRQWNPTKILPETLLPLCAEIAVRFVMPFTKDYIGSMGMVFAVVVSLGIVGYIMSFGKHLETEYGIKGIQSVLVMMLILLLHFLPFNTHISGNAHLFWADNVNCVFNYTIPGLLNGILFLVLFSADPEIQKRGKRYTASGILLLLIYLAVNSNMFQSIMISSLAGVKLLLSLFADRGRSEKRLSKRYLREYIHKNSLWLSVLVLWILSLGFEVQGGRASKAVSGISNLPVKETLKRFTGRMGSMNKLFAVIIGITVFSGLALCLYRRIRNIWDHRDSKFLRSIETEFLCLCITVVYLILLCSKVYPYYIERSYVLFAMIFYLIVMAASSLVYMVSKIPVCTVIMPLICYFLLFETVIDGKSFAEYNVLQYPGKQIKLLDEYYIEQILAADEAGFTEAEVHVAKHFSDTWPLGISEGGVKMAVSLYRHGLTDKMISAFFVADDMVNQMYHLPD